MKIATLLHSAKRLWTAFISSDDPWEEQPDPVAQARADFETARASYLDAKARRDTRDISVTWEVLAIANSDLLKAETGR